MINIIKFFAICKVYNKYLFDYLVKVQSYFYIMRVLKRILSNIAPKAINAAALPKL